MDAKTLYYRALRLFRDRNSAILPMLQLQHGRNERWLAREFALVMNACLADTWTPAALRLYADCEIGYGDISVWQHGATEGWAPEAVYEVKALYSQDFALTRRCTPQAPDRIAKKAAHQLLGTRVSTNRRLGLFFVVFASRSYSRARVHLFKQRARAVLRRHFDSDHHIRLSKLTPLRTITFGSAGAEVDWYTQSWISWGRPRSG